MDTLKQTKYMLFGLIALIAMLTACNFSTSAEIEPASNTVNTDLRLTAVSSPTSWSPTQTSTLFHTSTPAPTQTRVSLNNTGNSSGNSGSSGSSGNSGSSGSTNTGYIVNTSSPAPACGVVPAGGYSVNIRAWADLSATIVGTLTQGSWIYATRVSGNWYQVQYPGTPVNGAWISGNVVTLTQPCSCTPNCANVPPPKVCSITNHLAHGVMSQPYGNGYPVTTLGPNTTSVAVARLSDNSHYRIQTAAGSAWISVAQNVTISGDCSAIPVEVYNPPPQACTVRNQMAHGVMTAPYGQGQPLTQLGPNTSSIAVAKLADETHYKIQTSVGEGWINVVDNVTITGNCGQIPVLVIDPPPDECRIRTETALDVYPMPGWGQPITTLGPAAVVTGLARSTFGDFYEINTQAGNGWLHTGHSVSMTGPCESLPVKSVAPAPSGSNLTYTNSVYGIAFDYPDNWYVQETASQVIVTSYDPAYGDPAHAAFADPAYVKIMLRADAFAGTYEDWVAQYMAQVNGDTLSVFDEQTIALPGGIPALRLEMVGGTGGFPVLLTVINGYGVNAEGMMSNYTNFDRVVSTLRAAL